MPTRLGKLLDDLGIRPVLMDVGASGGPPPIWKDIAPNSTYIGFDPDLREIHEDRSSGFYRSVILNEAVTADSNATEVGFYLTRSPFCSTALAPNPLAAAHWLERDYFAVEGRASVRATTIDNVLTRLNIPRLDWIKLDTQGTDLRLINSLSPDVFTRLMAIDTEPGLVEIYQCEDLFVDVHRDLTRKGFWLSSMHTGGLIRMRRGTLEALRQKNPKIDDRYIRSATNVTPAYHEARYLRTLEWLAEHSMSQQEYLLLWIFALADGQLGFALDLSVEFDRIFGETDASQQLKAVTWLLMSKVRRRRALKSASAPVARGFRSVLGLLLD
jgi:Methyltransferase FkbM domain